MASRDRNTHGKKERNAETDALKEAGRDRYRDKVRDSWAETWARHRHGQAWRDKERNRG